MINDRECVFCFQIYLMEQEMAIWEMVNLDEKGIIFKPINEGKCY